MVESFRSFEDEEILVGIIRFYLGGICEILWEEMGINIEEIG